MNKFHLLTGLVILLFLTSCATSYVTIEVLKPAHITVPKEIKKVALINRSLPSKESKAENVVEGIFSGEGLFVDRFASKQCIDGLAMSLVESPRYDVIVPSIKGLEGTGTSRFPAPLDWNEARRICVEFEADAVIALETFDSDRRVKVDQRERERKDGERTVKYVEYLATMEIGVTSGWRIYYPDQEAIIDENQYTDYKSWSSANISKVKAEKSLPPYGEAVEKTGYFAGQQYGIRISPTWIPVSRSFYKKANDDFKKAYRLVKNDNWEEASEIWNRYTGSPDPKIAGRATYNLALAAEMNGNLESALEWAKKAYQDYNIKMAREYIRTLEIRIADQEKLKKQLD